LGSLFFKGLEIDYGCGAECAAKIWNHLAQQHSLNSSVIFGNQEIKKNAEIVVGQNLTKLFNLLEINN
jgi:hypothetical protein